jgi:hypothetical protein
MPAVYSSFVRRLARNSDARSHSLFGSWLFFVLEAQESIPRTLQIVTPTDERWAV